MRRGFSRIIEDELLLQVPFTIYHDEAVCTVKLDNDERQNLSDKKNPFSILNTLDFDGIEKKE